MSQRFKEILDSAFDYEESLKRQNLTHDDIVKLREKALRIPNVPKLMFDKQLILFTNVRSGNVDEAAEWIQKFYDIKQSSPEFFTNRNPDALKFSFTIQEMTPLPISPCNHFVFVHRVQNPDPSLYDFDDVVKMFMMMCEISIYTHGPRNGAIFISDWRGIRFGHLFCPSISSIRKSLDFIQRGSPIPMKAVHIFNASYLVQLMFAMIKPFMTKELFDIIHVHSSGMDFNQDFFEKFLPKASMPADYGGDLPSICELHEKNCEILCSFKEYFELEERHMQHQLDCLNNNESSSADGHHCT